MIWIAFDLPMILIILHSCCKSKYALRPRPLDCWNKFECNVWLLIGLGLVVAFLAWLSSRNYWEPQYLTHLQVGGKFFSTVTLLYYLCFAPNVLTAGVVLCCRVTWTFCLHLHFRGCSLLFFVVVHFCGSLWHSNTSQGGTYNGRIEVWKLFESLCWKKAEAKLWMKAEMKFIL